MLAFCLLVGPVLSAGRRNRILCKYPNQIHILKFNCFIQNFYLRLTPAKLPPLPATRVVDAPSLAGSRDAAHF